MIHPLLLLLGVFLVVVGVVICVLLVSVTIKGPKGIWLVTVPGFLITAFLGINFACHVLHLPPLLPYQKQISTAVHWVLDAVAVPLVVFRLYEWWQKRTQRKTISLLPQKPENP